MKLPQPIDYQQAVQRPDISFRDEVLSAGEPRRTPLGAPWAATGGFALTFDITSGRQRFAVRCFHRHGNRLQDRYAHIADFVGNNPDLDFLVEVTYLAEGILVEGDPLPIVRMPWVRGIPLNAWVEDHLDDHAALHRVREQVSETVLWLYRRGAAHGDLQHGNILVAPDNAVHLVDYDGMYLPPLREFGAAENGHRNYQHPDRNNHYDASLDLFAAEVIDLSLAALEHEPALWEEFTTDQNLLFSADDFADPRNSEVFSAIRRIPELADSAQRLLRACETDFDSVADVLRGRGGERTRPQRQRGTARASSTPPVLLAHDRAALVEREGDEVTIVGRIAARRTTTVRNGLQVTFLNFGNYRNGDFTLVAFDRTTRELRAQFGPELAELQDAWVSTTGFVRLYQSKWSRYVTPEIELQRARSLRVLTAGEVEEMLAKLHGAAEPGEDGAAARAGAAQGEGEDASDQVGTIGTTSVRGTAGTAVRPGEPRAEPESGASSRSGSDSSVGIDQQISRFYSASRFARGTGPGASPAGPDAATAGGARADPSSSTAGPHAVNGRESQVSQRPSATRNGSRSSETPRAPQAASRSSPQAAPQSPRRTRSTPGASAPPQPAEPVPHSWRSAPPPKRHRAQSPHVLSTSRRPLVSRSWWQNWRARVRRWFRFRSR